MSALETVLLVLMVGLILHQLGLCAYVLVPLTLTYSWACRWLGISELFVF